MRRTAVAGFVCAAAATFATASAAYEFDPLPRQQMFFADPNFRPQAAAIPREIVARPGRYAPVTVVISTQERRLYYIVGDGSAIRYAVGVGRPGFEWSGTGH